MPLNLFIYITIGAIIFALLEIQIEGEASWAKNLPCWKIKNPFKKIIAWPYLTGYHFYTWLISLWFFHLPYLFNLQFTLQNELLILECLFYYVFIEDFFWFVFNPAWGIKKFFTQEISWQGKKILYLPQNYWTSLLILLVFEIVLTYLT